MGGESHTHCTEMYVLHIYIFMRENLSWETEVLKVTNILYIRHVTG